MSSCLFCDFHNFFLFQCLYPNKMHPDVCQTTARFDSHIDWWSNTKKCIIFSVFFVPKGITYKRNLSLLFMPRPRAERRSRTMSAPSAVLLVRHHDRRVPRLPHASQQQDQRRRPRPPLTQVPRIAALRRRKFRSQVIQNDKLPPSPVIVPSTITSQWYIILGGRFLLCLFGLVIPNCLLLLM